MIKLSTQKKQKMSLSGALSLTIHHYPVLVCLKKILVLGCVACPDTVICYIIFSLYGTSAYICTRTLPLCGDSVLDFVGFYVEHLLVYAHYVGIQFQILLVSMWNTCLHVCTRAWPLCRDSVFVGFFISLAGKTHRAFKMPRKQLPKFKISLKQSAINLMSSIHQTT